MFTSTTRTKLSRKYRKTTQPQRLLGNQDSYNGENDIGSCSRKTVEGGWGCGVGGGVDYNMLKCS